MSVDWTRVLIEQFDLEWNLAHGPSLDTLTDEEYLWEPVPGCWSIRPTGPGGRGEFEQEGVAYFKEQARRWRAHIERIDEEGPSRLVGEPEAHLNAPWASLVLHVNREALHHLAEVSLLRDLYRAAAGTRLA
jgi:hypothetical protein